MVKCIFFIQIISMCSAASAMMTAGDFVQRCGVTFDQNDEIVAKSKSSPITKESTFLLGQHVHDIFRCSMYVDGLVEGMIAGGVYGMLSGLISLAESDEEKEFAKAEAKKLINSSLDNGNIPGFCSQKSSKLLGKVGYKYIKNHPESEEQPASSVLHSAWMEAFPPPCK